MTPMRKLALDAAHNNSLNKIPLSYEKQYNTGRKHDHCGSHQEVVSRLATDEGVHLKEAQSHRYRVV